MRFIDFFAGIGGFRLGMEQAGHVCVGHCEIDKFADKSYRAMHDVGESEWYAANIRDVIPGDLPEADCWCGGFPCQAFSVAGKRRGFEDMRGTLIFEVFRLAAERKPKILFLENVAGLLNHDGGRTFATILYGLWELGYDVQWQVLNSKNFGVPQNRERVFIVGYHGGFSGREVFPIYGTDGKTIKRHQADISGKGYKSQQDRIYQSGGVMGCIPSTRTENKVNVLIPCRLTTDGIKDIGKETNNALLARDYKGISRDGIGGGNNWKILSDSGQGRKYREQNFVSALRVGGDVQCVMNSELSSHLKEQNTENKLESNMNQEKFKKADTI